jgi:spore maturation protein SpmA
MAQINRGIKTIKPPNAVDRRKSLTTCPTSMPAIIKQSSIRITPRIIIQTRGHCRCNPCLLKVMMLLVVSDLSGIFTILKTKLMFVGRSRSTFSLLTRKKDFQLLLLLFQCRKKKKENNEKRITVKHLSSLS